MWPNKMAEQKPENKKEDEKIRCPVKEWPGRLRASLFVAALITLIASLIVVLKNDLVNKKIDETQNALLDFIGKEGFGLDDIVISGRERTAIEDIDKIVALERGDNILRVDVAKLKQNLETLPWIRDVKISRSFFPNVLQIEIKEKEVLAIWQLNERFYPIDMDGYVIEADYRPVNPILLIVGAGAAENIIPFLKMVAEINPQYVERIKVANYISKRRWNIILDDIRDGITVKLPAENVDQAWKKLLKLDAEQGILKRKLTIIDLRLEDKVTVKLRKSKTVQRISEQKI